MAIGVSSRFRWSEIYQDEQGRRFLGPRPRFGYRPLPDNREHPIRGGERLWHVSQLSFPDHPRAGALYWVIADFQPEPILDPTILLPEGHRLVIPSVRTLETLILATDRAKNLP